MFPWRPGGGFVVGHTPEVLTETVADFAVALMLAAARRLVEADGYTRAGKWSTWEPSSCWPSCAFYPG